jgi:phospholipase C
MSGQRSHRPLPYDFDVIATVTSAQRLNLEMINRGSVGVAISVHDNRDLQEPWHYTIGAGDRLVSEQWHDDGPLDNYDLTLRGPNGFWRRFAGSLAPNAPRADVLLVAKPVAGGVDVVLRNQGVTPMLFTLTLDEHYPSDGPRMRTVRVMPGIDTLEHWPLAASDHWYDLLVTLHDAPGFVRRFAGKVETGKPGRTDPGIGPMRLMV